jgi:kynureninase
MNASPRDLGLGSDPLPEFSTSREFAQDCDAADILAPYRRQFELPVSSSGQPLNYLCGHSLGLAPRAALDYVSEELADWAALGVGGHHTASRPWIDYAQNFTKGLIHVTGAQAFEVVAMNSLTVNLHLMMASLSTRRHARQGAHQAGASPRIATPSSDNFLHSSTPPAR